MEKKREDSWDECRGANLLNRSHFISRNFYRPILRTIVGNDVDFTVFSRVETKTRVFRVNLQREGGKNRLWCPYVHLDERPRTGDG